MATKQVTRNLVIATPTSTKSMPLNVWLERWQEQNRRNTISAYAAYRHVPWVYKSVNLVANASMGVPFALMRGDEPVATERDYQDVLPFVVDLPALINYFIGDWLLYGRCYWKRKINPFGYDTIKRLHPAKVTEVKDGNDEVIAFEYRSMSTYEYHDILGGDIKYAWLPNRENDDGAGDPPVISALKAAGFLNAMYDMGIQYFEQGGVGPVIYEFEGYEDASPEEQERVKDWLRQFAKGVKNMFAPLASPSGVNVHHAGASMKDLHVAELSKDKREDVAAPFGIPASLMFSNSANYATAKVDEMNMYNLFLLPTYRLLAGQLNQREFEPLGLKLQEEHHRLEIYQANELEKAQKMDTARNRGDMTRNEWREQMNLPPMEDEPEPQPEQPQVMQLDDGNTVDAEFTVMDDKDDPITDDLNKWQRKASRRFAEGSREKAFEFESAHIRHGLRAAIVGGLQAAHSEDDVKAVFEAVKAANWVQYG